MMTPYNAICVYRIPDLYLVYTANWLVIRPTTFDQNRTNSLKTTLIVDASILSQTLQTYCIFPTRSHQPHPKMNKTWKICRPKSIDLRHLQSDTVDGRNPANQLVGSWPTAFRRPWCFLHIGLLGGVGWGC